MRRLRKTGRCTPFADPIASASIDQVFWHADHLPSSLPVLARRAPTDADELADVDVTQLTTVRRILIDASGTEHIVLQSGYHTITLRNQGVSTIEAPLNLTFLIDRLAGIAAAPRLLRLARSLLDPNSSAKLNQNGPSPWYPKLREVLLALDADQAGATHREIAAVLYGHNIVDEAWRSGNLSYKQRVHRAVAKGRALSAGGYVALLR